MPGKITRAEADAFNHVEGVGVVLTPGYKLTVLVKRNVVISVFGFPGK